MAIITVVISILLLTGLVSLARRLLPFTVCPICAGVSLTWLWILAGIYSGWLAAGSWQLLAALAMGGSVVGIAYQLEKRLAPGRSPLVWKTLFIPAGFAAVYGLVRMDWWLALSALAAALVIVIIFLRRSPQKSGGEISNRAAELEQKMKDCC